MTSNRPPIAEKWIRLNMQDYYLAYLKSLYVHANIVQEIAFLVKVFSALI